MDILFRVWKPKISFGRVIKLKERKAKVQAKENYILQRSRGISRGERYPLHKSLFFFWYESVRYVVKP